MNFFSDCSGECKDCIINYYNSCLAGHGDDDFVEITKDEAIELIENNKLTTDQINYLKSKFNILHDDSLLDGFINQFSDGPQGELDPKQWNALEFLEWLKLNNFEIIKKK